MFILLIIVGASWL
ncbi:YjcZ family sporulation protein [Bacillus sp. FJAT-29790]|nr:YjcZ family sporulation protein [Bacillus sp. FJAT-29790]